MPKIYDTFIFNDELAILELRLEVLYDHVDFFVLVESNQTFTLKHSPKKLYFSENSDRFRKFADKIIHIRLINEFVPGNPWRNEHLQRNSVSRGLVKANDNDIVLMSDVDEIPDPELFKSLPEILRHQTATFNQKMFRYFLNCQCTHEEWKGTRAISRGRLDLVGGAEALRHMDGKILDNGGFHYTGIGGVDQFMKKMGSFSHSDICDVPQYQDREEMRKLFKNNVIEKGIDVHSFNRATYKVLSDPKEFLPQGVSSERYGQYIYKGQNW